MGGSGKGRSVVHRARGRVVAYETSTEQVWVFIYHRDISRMSYFPAITLRTVAVFETKKKLFAHPQMEAALKCNPVLADLLDSTAWQHTSDSTISQVRNALVLSCIAGCMQCEFMLYTCNRSACNLFEPDGLGNPTKAKVCCVMAGHDRSASVKLDDACLGHVPIDCTRHANVGFVSHLIWRLSRAVL